MNCGCGMMDDNMGSDDNLTLTDLAKAAKASKQKPKEALEEMRKSLNQITQEELAKKMEAF